MIIKQEIRDAWKEIACRGDQTKMSGGDKSLRTYISLAINGFECTEETFKIIKDFYNKRAKLLKSAIIS